MEPSTGLIHLTTLLAHSGGEWISSDWPVCGAKDTEAPHRMGAALTYARRYTLFALVGIAGEDDLDAPDILMGSPPAAPRSNNAARGKQGRGGSQRRLPANREQSAMLRDQMLDEIRSLDAEEELLVWAKDGLALKNTLLDADAQAIELAYQSRREQTARPDGDRTKGGSRTDAGSTDSTHDTHDLSPYNLPRHDLSPDDISDATTIGLAFPKEPVRKRSKAHPVFIRRQPCVVCKHAPCDPHHLRFAQPKALGRKVSDEFTVPLCRAHHHDLHRHANEKAWWADLQIAPLPIAKALWDASPIHAVGAA